ncbi:DNA gyrase inhibitor YacG [Marinobacter sp. C2H3]|uniref:DNA gyrase inhibitor YacG n=1 Tax=Marinobacter sp. C2H3 TaxID=3119003 RepID=UPI00300F21AA
MIVQCPTCKQSVEWDDANRYRPFCSERCQLIDLGAWANEEYRVPAEEEDALSDAYSSIDSQKVEE